MGPGIGRAQAFSIRIIYFVICRIPSPCLTSGDVVALRSVSRDTETQMSVSRDTSDSGQ